MSGSGRNLGVLQDLNLHLKLCSDHLHPSLASIGTKTTHLVVCFLLTHKLIFSMLVAEKSNVLSSFQEKNENGNQCGRGIQQASQSGSGRPGSRLRSPCAGRGGQTGFCLFVCHGWL